jgi:hypothetical protein
MRTPVEPFHATYTEQVCTLSVEPAPDLPALEEGCVARVADLLHSGELSRERSAGWRTLDADGAEVGAPPDRDDLDLDEAAAGTWANLAWDGLRALPYTDEEVAVAMGRTLPALPGWHRAAARFPAIACPTRSRSS